ncbi:hypothetical protein N7495_002776 [Penicillium taxi]|uniref:uncharacterized protein n=1 Tax=Penicillium taxi TaxID=168475 RepID=UPI002545B72E|nr:uncharacterized protein N7495_002776 [Penicillium taxi]KAJ5902248.1 hypothetical protein N7495_002776 [Penicillium taxi]
MHSFTSLLALSVLLLQALPVTLAAPVPDSGDSWVGGYGNANGIDNIANTQLDRREPLIARQTTGGYGNANGVGNEGNVQLDRREIDSSADIGPGDFAGLGDFPGLGDFSGSGNEDVAV